MKLSHLVLASLLSSSAFAAPATVVSVEGQSKIGKDGAWRPAKTGETVGDAEFLSVSPESVVKVKLGDGTPADFRGKVVVPGRRLGTQKSAGPLLKFSESLQKAAEAVVGVDVKGTAPGASKADDKTATKTRLLMMGDQDSGPRSTKAEFAEKALQRHDLQDAENRAKGILADPGESALEKRRAHLILGRVHLDEAEYTKALAELSAAAADLAPEEKAARKLEKAKVIFDPTGYRAAALVFRGIAYRQLGDDAKAKTDFTSAISAFPQSTQAYQASFQLLTMSLEGGDKAAATKHFEAIPQMKEEDTSEEANETRMLRELASELLQRPTL